MRVTPVLVGMLCVALACAPAQPPAPAVDVEAERAGLLAADRAWAESFQAADDKLTAFVSQFVEGADFLAPDAAATTGADGIRAVLGPMMATEGVAVTWQPLKAEVSAGGDLGYTIGTVTTRMPGPDGALMQSNGKYITVWRKQADGGWKVVADTYNADGPPVAVQ